MATRGKTLTHLDAAGLPTMVDVSAKAVTAREAKAECRVRFPADVAAQLHASGLRSAKGGIVETAIIAGTMAVKRTHELIPFCHPLPIDGCRIGIAWDDDTRLEDRVHGQDHASHRRGDGGADRRHRRRVDRVRHVQGAVAPHRHRPGEAAWQSAAASAISGNPDGGSRAAVFRKPARGRRDRNRGHRVPCAGPAGLVCRGAGAPRFPVAVGEPARGRRWRVRALGRSGPRWQRESPSFRRSAGAEMDRSA